MPTSGPHTVKQSQHELERRANLIASGEAEFPDDLPKEEAQALSKLVRQKNRARLQQFIARQIALSLRDDSKESPP